MKTSEATHMSSGGVAGFLRRLFGQNAPRSENQNARRDEHAAKSAAQSHAHDGDPAWVQHLPKFAPFAQALGIDFNLPVALSEADRERAQQLMAAMVDAVAHDESGPTSLPTAALRTLNLVARPDVPLSELASSISQDAALTAAVLRMANSAGMKGAGEVHTVRDAVTRLGVIESGRVAGTVAAKTLFSPRLKSAHALFASQFAELHVAAAAAAGGAAQLAMERGVGRSDLAYLGGMLHEVGKSLGLAALASLILADKAPRDLEPNLITFIIESRHVELGVRAHERWELPQYLTTLCASQHLPEVPADPAHAELHLVRVVSGLLAVRVRPQSIERLQELVQSLSALSITPLQARAIDAGLRTRLGQVKQALG
jgi:HD-like signal output (HDOD) protein